MTLGISSPIVMDLRGDKISKSSTERELPFPPPALDRIDMTSSVKRKLFTYLCTLKNTLRTGLQVL